MSQGDAAFDSLFGSGRIPPLASYRIESYDQIESTNMLAKQRLAQGAQEGLVVCACRQSGGYGQRGRRWESPAGGLYFSVLLRPQVPEAQMATLGLLMALALVRAVEACGCLYRGAGAQSKRGVRIKWPNDVLLVSKDESTGKLDAEAAALGKLAGILLEKQGAGVCLGVGVNVFPWADCKENRPLPEDQEVGDLRFSCCDQTHDAGATARNCSLKYLPAFLFDTASNQQDAVSGRQHGVASNQQDAASGFSNDVASSQHGASYSQHDMASSRQHAANGQHGTSCGQQSTSCSFSDDAASSQHDTSCSFSDDATNGQNDVSRGQQDAGSSQQLSATARQRVLDQLLKRILDEFFPLYEQWQREGLRPFMADFARYDFLAGRQVGLLDTRGTKLAAGQALGIDESGALLLQVQDDAGESSASDSQIQDGVRACYSGEVCW